MLIINIIKVFWEIIKEYKLDNINALSSENGYKEIPPIEELFTFINNEILFCFKIKEKLICSLCNIYEEKDLFHTVLISINNNDIYFNSLIDIFLNFKMTNFCIYENCIYDESKNNTYL